jgi:hypothetical protein
MRMLGRTVSAHFLDARDVPPDLALEKRRKLGKKIWERVQRDALAGVLFHSAERPSGTRICVLDGDVLDRAVQGEHFRFSWNGQRVAALYAFNSTGADADNLIDPGDLIGEADILAA